MRSALLYGLCAMLCFVLTDLTVVDVMGSELRNLRDLTHLFVLGVSVFGLASLGWALWHRRQRRPGTAGYGLLAVAVTLAAHFAFVAMLLSTIPSDLEKFVQLSLFGLVLHGWFTVPIALLATWAFVRWQRRAG